MPLRLILPAAALLLGGALQPLPAQSFYRGKTLTFVVDYSAGGPTDIECRLYARHLIRYLEGEPTIVVVNRPGAGGVLAMNWLYERARRDGTVVGCQTASPMYQEYYVGNPRAFGLRAKMPEMIPVMFAPVVSVGAVRTRLPPGVAIQRPEDILKAGGWIAGGFRADNSKDLKFRAILDLVGADYRYVTGYPGSADLLAAFLRQEVDYIDGSTPLYLTRVKPVAVARGLAIPIWYDSPVDLPQLAPAYNSEEFIQKLTGRPASGLLWHLFQIHRAYRMVLFPPGVPPPAVETLRSAFHALGRDAAFLAEYEKVAGIGPTFMTAEAQLEEALKPLRTATEEIRKLRHRYIEEVR